MANGQTRYQTCTNGQVSRKRAKRAEILVEQELLPFWGYRYIYISETWQFCENVTFLGWWVENMTRLSLKGCQRDLQLRDQKPTLNYLGVSKNRGTTKSSILIGLSWIFHYFHHPFWGTTIFWKHPFGEERFYPNLGSKNLRFSKPGGSLQKLKAPPLWRGLIDTPSALARCGTFRFKELLLKTGWK